MKMKLFNKMIICFASLFVFSLSACNESKNEVIQYDSNSNEEKQYIGFSTDNKSLESHDVTIYYGRPEKEIEYYVNDYELLNAYQSANSDDYYTMHGYRTIPNSARKVMFTIIRTVYESTSKENSAWNKTIIYEERNELSRYLLDSFLYGRNTIVDTIKKDDLYNNQDGYGYITYTWYITENDESPLYRDVHELAKASTVNLYYTIDGDLITFKVAKQ
ncbi:MAG: hypothetical protein J5936_03345 [Acholeplasmatales bacterium]|nr:hypothetical protein [Acholeplasmatales bacterium]